MSTMTSYRALTDLWETWQRLCAGQHDPVPSLRALLAQGGTRLSARELRFALQAAGSAEGLTPERFADCMIPLLGDAPLRVDHAFGYFGPADAPVAVGQIRAALQHFLTEEAHLAAMLEEMDADGDRLVTLDDFHSFYPHGEPVGAGGYHASHVHPSRIGASPPERAMTPAPAPVRPQTEAQRFTATSPLQMQIGFFRLLQGAAYRSFRESFSANAETHLRARDLPYTITDFEAFVSATVELYLSLDIVSGAEVEAEFRSLATRVSDEVEALETRVETWPSIAKSEAMLRAEAQLDEERDALGDQRTRFAQAVEFLLALRMHGITPETLGPDSLSAHERHRLSHLEAQAEHGHGAESRPLAGDAGAYLEAWNPVNLDGGARPDGAIMPVGFWYESFMPQLLRCASILSPTDLPAAREPDLAALDRWHAAQVAQDAFLPYANDLRDGFNACAPPVKLALKQAWRLTEHYLNGLEKRREREEFGRGSGFLSQYVAFVDVWLGRSDVAESEMRLSFPYYIGPAVWSFLHSAAERIEALDAHRRAAAIARFKTFFGAFATMYPCPYCRHHLNRYVVRNREVDRYPVEFLLLGQQADKPPLEISLDDRLTEISAEVPGSLRRFLWKLHNAVSASIARTEDWYHPEARPLYTTRFWPGLDAEIARARALGLDTIPVERLADILEILKPAARLATLRDEIQGALQAENREGLGNLMIRAKSEIAILDEAVEASRFLPRSYGYDPTKTEAAPHFSPQEEAFARSGRFIER